MFLLASCQTTTIPNIKFYAEIPFVDCPEGVYVESVSKARGIIKCEEWKKLRPFMIMIDPDGKKAIQMQWLEACRWADNDSTGSCNVSLDSVRTTIELLDKLAGSVLGP